MTIAWTLDGAKEGFVFFDHVHQLIAYLERNYQDRIDKYGHRRAIGEPFHAAFQKSFDGVINIYKYTSYLPLLKQEMDFTVEHIVRADMACLDEHHGVGAFLHGKPVWTAEIALNTLHSMLEEQKGKPQSPARYRMEKAINAELAAIHSRLQ